MLVWPYGMDEDAGSKLKTAVALAFTVKVTELLVISVVPPSQPAPGVPMTVKELVPASTPSVVDIVRIEVDVEPPVPTTNDGLNVAVAPLGNEEVPRVTVQEVEFPPKLTAMP
jgi:hypothetical protein